MTTPNIEIRRVGVEQIVELRHRILRAGLPPVTARFEADEAETTLHLAAFSLNDPDRRPDQAVGCLSVMLNSFNGEPAWQLRGMAVDGPYQRLGLGGKLLAQAEEALAAKDKPGLIWCNARVPAAGFYQKHGWETASEIFEIPMAGPHLKMSKRLNRANPRAGVEKPGGQS